jgi:hypothetical protein
MKKIYCLFSVIVFIALTAVSQTTVLLSAVKDNTIYQNFAGNSNGAGPDFFAGNNNGNSPRRALIKFDIAAVVPAGATISSVTLTLVCNRTRAAADNVTLHTLNADWGEGTSDGGATNDGDGATATVNDATWPCSFANGSGGCTTSWTTVGGDFNSTASATSSVGAASPAPYSWSSAQMVSDVQAWLNTAVSNFGWIIIGDESTNQTAKRFASKDNGTASDRPQLSVTYTGGLPVTLLVFKAREIKTGVLLNWETAQEFNNAFFSIEHSTDGIHFFSAGKVTGSGTTSSNHSYQFIHEGIEAGRHYYRLAQTDIDGRISYSNVVLINNKNSYFFLQIKPNPVSNKIVLQGSVNWSGSNYVIINQAGSIVLSGRLISNSINVNPLAKGAYYIRLLRANDAVILSGQFLKQ